MALGRSYEGHSRFSPDANLTDGDAASSRPHTGIKHLVTNKARIFGHADFVDRDPCLLLVPILTLKKAVDWDGSDCEAIVVIDGTEGTDGIPVKRVAAGIGMTAAGQEDSLAADDEIEDA